jgi:hypothetical protein
MTTLQTTIRHALSLKSLKRLTNHWGGDWKALKRVCLIFWNQFRLPVYVTTESVSRFSSEIEWRKVEITSKKENSK